MKRREQPSPRGDMPAHLETFEPEEWIDLPSTPTEAWLSQYMATVGTQGTLSEEWAVTRLVHARQRWAAARRAWGAGGATDAPATPRHPSDVPYPPVPSVPQEN